MLRSIPSRRLFAPRSLFVHPIVRFFSRNTTSNHISHSLEKYTENGFVQPPRLFNSQSLFSTSQQRRTFYNEKKPELGDERQKALKQHLKADPEHVTSTSSMTPIFDPNPRQSGSAQRKPSDDPDMLRGLRSDLRIVKETFGLNEVPREVLYIGMGGLIPYLGTSLSTLYLAWDIEYSVQHGVGYLVSGDTAGHLLHILEPLQVGLGAVILSFLGAIHWGLEMAGYGGRHAYKRYSLSILAPVLAWPTLLLPLDYALLAQFIGFTGMYFADSTAASTGWAPRWYMTYRFLLTFVVGGCIVMTLVGRGQIGDRITRIHGPTSHFQDLRDTQWEDSREEERNATSRKERKATKTGMRQSTAADSRGERNVDDGKITGKEREDEGQKNKAAVDNSGR